MTNYSRPADKTAVINTGTWFIWRFALSRCSRVRPGNGTRVGAKTSSGFSESIHPFPVSIHSPSHSSPYSWTETPPIKSPRHMQWNNPTTGPRFWVALPYFYINTCNFIPLTHTLTVSWAASGLQLGHSLIESRVEQIFRSFVRYDGRVCITNWRLFNFHDSGDTTPVSSELPLPPCTPSTFYTFSFSCRRSKQMLRLSSLLQSDRLFSPVWWAGRGGRRARG